MPLTAWWRDSGALQRFAADLLMAELRRQRPGAPAIQPPIRWHDNLMLDESGLGADSLERLRLAAALAGALTIRREDKGDNLLIARTFGQWLETCRDRLSVGDATIGFQTSGSTGVAKPCFHALIGLEEEARFLANLFPARKRVLTAVPAHHIYGFLFTILLPQALGGIPVIDLRPHSPAALDSLWRPGDLIVGYPDFWREVARSAPSAPPDIAGVTSTAPCPTDVAIAVAACAIRLVEVFGSTETAGIGWRDDPDAPFRMFAHWRWDGGDTIARTLPSGATLTVPLPDLLETVEDGGFRASGRRDAVVQVGGVNVSLAEVREVLRRHPLVAEVAVRLMRPEEGTRLKAFVVPTADAPPPVTLRQDLMTWAETALSPPCRPRAFTFGPDLPTTLLGKKADWNLDESSR